MQIEVLRYIHSDYEVIIRTQDISYSWERFKGRSIILEGIIQRLMRQNLIVSIHQKMNVYYGYIIL